MKKMKETTLLVLMTVVMTLIFSGCSFKSKPKAISFYIGADFENLPASLNCDILVIDAQYYTSEQLQEIKENRNVKKIYSYLNVGSLEDFRPYYDSFKDIALAPYENWEGEYWVDVTDKDWQNLIAGTIAPTLVRGGVDGIFVDNLDVYYLYPTDEIYNAITEILTSLKSWRRPVIINGGNDYVTRYLDENGKIADLFDGVCQESVYTSVNWDDGSFIESSDDDREYFLDYLASVKKEGKKVYVIEYTKDQALSDKIKAECSKQGYSVFISDSLGLGN